MRRLRLLLPLILCLPAACMMPPRESTSVAPDMAHVVLKPAFEGLKFENPVFIGSDGANAGKQYVLEQDGRVMQFDNREDAANAKVFLDIRERVLSRADGGDGEEGLIGLAFHPHFAENGQFFVAYTAGMPKQRRNVLARFTVGSDGTADPQSGQALLDFEKPFGNHNGGSVAFGPDGYLYVAYGDGGGKGDPKDNAQNLEVLFGKILRIDVDRKDPGLPYGIPDDNPFVARGGARPEIFAYGLRNPWRMSFDGANLWVGQVGEQRWEAVYVVTRGGNLGWSKYEGSHPFKGGEAEALIPPLAEYGHSMWDRCVVGGGVYRGSRHPALQGMYLYADFGSGRIWGLRYDNGVVSERGEVLVTLKPMISSFGTDAANEMYVTCLDGKIYRVTGDGRAVTGGLGGR